MPSIIVNIIIQEAPVAFFRRMLLYKEIYLTDFCFII